MIKTLLLELKNPRDGGVVHGWMAMPVQPQLGHPMDLPSTEPGKPGRVVFIIGLRWDLKQMPVKPEDATSGRPMEVPEAIMTLMVTPMQPAQFMAEAQKGAIIGVFGGGVSVGALEAAGVLKGARPGG